MLRGAVSRIMWVGRATVFVLGVAVILALLFGVASMALGANGKPFILGQKNTASKVSKLVKSGAGPALRLEVDSGAPLAVNSSGRVNNLNADQLDGRDAADLLTGSTYIKQQNFAAPAGEEQDNNVSCDDGDTLLSGGYQTTQTFMQVLRSFASTENTWTVRWRNNSASTDLTNQSVRVLCADTNPGNPDR